MVSETQTIFIPLYSNFSYALVYKIDFRILNKRLRRAFKLDPLSLNQYFLGEAHEKYNIDLEIRMRN